MATYHENRLLLNACSGECDACSRKKKNFQPPTGDTLRQIMVRAVAGWNEFDHQGRSLLEVNSDNIVISEAGKTLKLPFSFNSAGVLIFDLPQDVSSYHQFSKDVALGIFNHLMQGDLNMSDNILLPSELTIHEDEEVDLQKLHEDADKAGLLLPTQFNAPLAKKETKQQEATNLLMPIGVDGR